MFPLDGVSKFKNKKVRALCRYGISENGCMWERCRPPEVNIFTIIKGDKEGQTSGWNKSGLNNKCKSISWLSDCYHLFKDKGSPSFGACAPPSPDLTFYAYDFLRRVGRLLMIILPSGNLSRRSRATLPEGESFLSRHLRATLPEGESFFIYPEGENFLIFIYYVNTYLVLFCYTFYGYRYMDIDCAVI